MSETRGQTEGMVGGSHVGVCAFWEGRAQASKQVRPRSPNRRRARGEGRAPASRLHRPADPRRGDWREQTGTHAGADPEADRIMRSGMEKAVDAMAGVPVWCTPPSG